MNRPRYILFAIVLLAFVASACSSGNSSSGSGSSSDKTIKIGETSGESFSRLPARVTQDRLNGSGWKIQSVGFNGTDLTAEAVSSGDVNLGRIQILDALKTIQKGGNVAVLMADRPDEFVLIAKNEIASCADLNGKKFAVQSKGSAYTAMSEQWMSQGGCNAKPQQLIISGGENRVVALVNGQIDATFVQLADWINLNNQKPGQFHILMTFSREMPGLIGGVLFANKDWLASHKEIATQYVEEALKDIRQANQDPKSLEAAANKYQTAADVKSFSDVYAAYSKDLHGFPANGVLTSATLQTTIDLFTSLKLLDPGLTSAQAADLSVLDGALAAIGRSPEQ
jgi:ABC-type nitrate/sulfonate/bicarbonate transport system substrate-binding protein